MVSYRYGLTTAALVLVLMQVGCQQSNTLSGAVTYNGEPVQKGSIAFQSADGGRSFGADIASGRYKVDMSHPGKHTVLIRGVHERQAPQSTEEAIRQYEEAKAAGKATLDHYGQPADYVPEDAEGNSQTIEIQPGAQTVDFALSGPPRSG
jgi:hypothetical protein